MTVMPKSPTPAHSLWDFYIQGREDPLSRDGEIELDENKIAQGMRAAGPAAITPNGLHRHIHDAVEAEIAHLRTSKAKRNWADDRSNARAIKNAGVSVDDAYNAYLQGRIDETSYSFEEGVATILAD